MFCDPEPCTCNDSKIKKSKSKKTSKSSLKPKPKVTVNAEVIERDLELESALTVLLPILSSESRANAQDILKHYPDRATDQRLQDWLTNHEKD